MDFPIIFVKKTKTHWLYVSVILNVLDLRGETFPVVRETWFCAEYLWKSQISGVDWTESEGSEQKQVQRD